MNWSVINIYLVDNLNLIVNLIESYLYSLYSSLAFLNVLVDTAETYGVFMLVLVVLIHQFNAIVFTYTNFSLFGGTSLSTQSNSTLKVTSFSRLFVGSLILNVLNV